MHVEMLEVIEDGNDGKQFSIYIYIYIYTTLV
jgi:hypothetical protein